MLGNWGAAWDASALCRAGGNTLVNRALSAPGSGAVLRSPQAVASLWFPAQGERPGFATCTECDSKVPVFL